MKYLYPLIILLIFFSSCEERESIPKEDKDKYSGELGPDQIAWDVNVVFVDSSFTKAILKARRARVYNGPMETLLDSGLKVDFFSRESGARISHLTADSARIDDRTKNMLARGNVVVISDSSARKLETSVLSWDNKTQKFYSSEFVKITSPDEVIQGYGLESDVQLSKYKILGVSGEKR